MFFSLMANGDGGSMYSLRAMTAPENALHEETVDLIFRGSRPDHRQIAGYFHTELFEGKYEIAYLGNDKSPRIRRTYIAVIVGSFRSANCVISPHLHIAQEDDYNHVGRVYRVAVRLTPFSEEGKTALTGAKENGSLEQLANKIMREHGIQRPLSSQ